MFEGWQPDWKDIDTVRLYNKLLRIDQSFSHALAESAWRACIKKEYPDENARRKAGYLGLCVPCPHSVPL